MKSKNILMWFGVFALALAWPMRIRAADAELDEATKARIAKAEAGLAVIDVSAYPKGIQENYQVFSEKCTQCHKLSRPINSDYAVPAEWERYVKRMMHKPGSGIDSSSGKKIFEFLVYDSSVRKKVALEAKLAKATPEEKKAAQDKIQEVHQKYDGK